MKLKEGSDSIILPKIKEKFNISSSVLDEINLLLESKNFNKILLKFRKIIDNGKNIYNKYGLNELEKEKILNIILNNLTQLFENLNFSIVHNSTLTISKDIHNLSFEEQLYKFFLTNSKQNYENIIGISCNNLIFWFYDLLKYITGDDFIDFIFNLEVKNNHGKMFLNFGNSKYTLELLPKSILLEKIEYNKFQGLNGDYIYLDSKKFDNIYYDFKKYKKDAINYSLEKKILKFVIDDKSLYIEKIEGNKYYIGFIKDIKNIKNKILSENGLEIELKINSLIYLGKINLDNIEAVKNNIIHYFKNENKEIVSKMLNMGDINKMNNFFGFNNKNL